MNESFFQWITKNNTKLIEQYEDTKGESYNPVDDDSQSAFARYCQEQWRKYQVSKFLVA